MMRRTRLLIVALFALATAGAPSASAHLLYQSDGWMHATHGRDYYFYNGATQTGWQNACRDAQLNWHTVMNGSLRFYSTSHDASILHCLDANYGDSGFVGRSTHPGLGILCAHCGHTHLDMNQYYNFLVPFPSDKQSVACHEIGHPVGLAHSIDADDCMHTPYSGLFPTIGYAHRDQLRAQYTATGH